MNKIKPYILPCALVLGLLFHSLTIWVVPLVPYIIFSILLLNFSAVDLRTIHITRLDVAIMVFQTVFSIGAYIITLLISGNDTLAEGALISILCPVASSVVVVAAALGADRKVTTGYTIWGNLLVAFLAPVIFSFVGINRDMPLLESAMLIFKRVATVIALPYLLALILQFTLPKVSAGLGKLKEWALPLWACALLITLGQTIDYIFLYHEGNTIIITILAGIAIVACFLQFYVGRVIGKRCGEKIAGGQMAAQKNSAMGIWMASTYLTPLASVVLAFYSILQNLFNSWQMWKYNRK